MSKSILVIDTPESCEECILYSGYSCYAYTKPIPCKKPRPDWCPLSPLPERKNLRQYVDNTACDIGSMMAYQYTQGYNSCIDEILKGKE